MLCLRSCALLLKVVVFFYNDLLEVLTVRWLALFFLFFNYIVLHIFVLLVENYILKCTEIILVLHSKLLGGGGYLKSWYQLGVADSCGIQSLMTVNGNFLPPSLLKCSVALMDRMQWFSYVGKYSSYKWLSFVISNLRIIFFSFFLEEANWMFLSGHLFSKLLREDTTTEEPQMESCQTCLKLQCFPVYVYDSCCCFIGVLRCFIIYLLPKGKGST